VQGKQGKKKKAFRDEDSLEVSASLHSLFLQSDGKLKPLPVSCVHFEC